MYFVVGVNLLFWSRVPQWVCLYVFLPVLGLVVGVWVVAYWYPWLLWIVTFCFVVVFGGLPRICFPVYFLVHCTINLFLWLFWGFLSVFWVVGGCIWGMFVLLVCMGCLCFNS